MLLEITTLIVASRLAEAEKDAFDGEHLVIREARTGHNVEVYNDKNK